MEKGIRLMLASRSAKVKHSAISGKSHGVRNLPGSPSSSAFSRFFSSFLLDGYGIEDFGLGFRALTGAIIGSEIGEVTGSDVKIRDSDWTTRGWTSSVLSLLKNPPLKHFIFEKPELGKQELGKLEVGKLRVDKQEWEENQEDEFDLTSSEDDSWSNAFTISLSSAPSGEIPE
nr:hypothetical protein [Tanacetum cinerariifolium]